MLKKLHKFKERKTCACVYHSRGRWNLSDQREEAREGLQHDWNWCRNKTEGKRSWMVDNSGWKRRWHPGARCPNWYDLRWPMMTFWFLEPPLVDPLCLLIVASTGTDILVPGAHSCIILCWKRLARVLTSRCQDMTKWNKRCGMIRYALWWLMTAALCSTG